MPAFRWNYGELKRKKLSQLLIWEPGGRQDKANYNVAIVSILIAYHQLIRSFTNIRL